ncbi:MAG: hypothetical protein AAGF11_18870 [Myxococcota bacterium]
MPDHQPGTFLTHSDFEQQLRDCTQSFVVRWDPIPRLTTLLSTLGDRTDDDPASGKPS